MKYHKSRTDNKRRSIGEYRVGGVIEANFMTEDEITNLAIDCGALIKPHPIDNEITLITFTMDELKEFMGKIPFFVEIKCEVGGGGGGKTDGEGGGTGETGGHNFIFPKPPKA